MKPISPTLRGTLFVALSGTLFGFLGFLGTRLLEMNFSIENMLFWRFLFASLFMLPSIGLLKKIPNALTSGSSLLKTLIFSAIIYMGSSAFYFFGSRYIGTGLAMVAFFSFPLFVTLIMWLFDGWKPNKYAIISLIAVVIGLILIKGNGEETLHVFGIFFAVMAAICYAIYIYNNRVYAKSIDTGLLTLFVCIGNTLIFLGWSILNQSFLLPTTWKAWVYILALGIVATALPIRFMLDGMKYISPVKASILSVLEPIVTLIVGFFLLNEHMSSLQLTGVITILFAAVAIQFEKNQED